MMCSSDKKTDWYTDMKNIRTDLNLRARQQLAGSVAAGSDQRNSEAWHAPEVLVPVHIKETVHEGSGGSHSEEFDIEVYAPPTPHRITPHSIKLRLNSDCVLRLDPTKKDEVNKKFDDYVIFDNQVQADGKYFQEVSTSRRKLKRDMTLAELDYKFECQDDLNCFRIVSGSCRSYSRGI